MMDVLHMIANWLGADRYSQHAICLTNDPVMMFLFIAGDLVTMLSYLIIGIALVVSRMQFVIFSPVTRGLYGAFIILCALSHGAKMLTMFSGMYRLEVVILAMTAVVSAYTAFFTWKETSGAVGERA